MKYVISNWLFCMNANGVCGKEYLVEHLWNTDFIKVWKVLREGLWMCNVHAWENVFEKCAGVRWMNTVLKEEICRRAAMERELVGKAKLPSYIYLIPVFPCNLGWLILSSSWMADPIQFLDGDPITHLDGWSYSALGYRIASRSWMVDPITLLDGWSHSALGWLIPSCSWMADPITLLDSWSHPALG